MLTKEVLEILPNSIKKQLEGFKYLDKLQEIRIKVDKPLFLVCNNQEYMINYTSTAEDIKIVLQRISNYSIYAFEERKLSKDTLLFKVAIELVYVETVWRTWVM